MSRNKQNLTSAKNNKNDEFYTQLSDIESEILCTYDYQNYFKGKTILCNCDDPEWSNFVIHFERKFKTYGLNKLISTHYNKFGESYRLDYQLDENNNMKCIKTPLKGDGDFRSEECIKILDEADVVCTNPPFSLFRPYISQLENAGKKFLIIGNKNAITFNQIFKLFKEDKLWLGYTAPDNFLQPDGTMGNLAGLTRWFTNIDISKRYKNLDLYKKYTPEEYPKYDNYDAINVDKVENIPVDYEGVMGVPITFLDKYNPNQFEIIGLGNSRDNFTPNKDYISPKKVLKNGRIVDGGAINSVLAIETDKKPENTIYYTSENSKYLIAPYARILIRKKKEFKYEFVW